MKIKSALTRCICILAIGHFIMLNLYSQDSYIKNRWNFKAGYARYKAGYKASYQKEEPTTGNYRIEANYGITKYFETGLYLGYSGYKESSIGRNRYPTPFYGMNINFQLFPLFIKKPNFRFDAFIAGKFGGLYFSKFVINNHKIEYALGGGLCFYPWKHVGFYTEYCFGNYLYEDTFSPNDHTKFRYGLSLKF